MTASPAPLGTTTPVTTANTLKDHFEQIDGLRALAAISVISEHFTLWGEQVGFPFGLFGLWLFFVLSGFLITGILLRARADAGGERSAIAHAWRAFYARRVLRIFPLYYTVLIGALVLGFPGVRASFVWNALDLANVVEVWRTQALGFGHFWSLSVEEQFYLIWPTVVLLAPRRGVYIVATGMVLVAPLSRLTMMTLSPNMHWARVVPPSCLDGLGIGALLGLIRDGGGIPASWRFWFRRVSLGLGLAILVGVYVAGLSGAGYRLPFSLRYSGYALVCFWLIDRAADGFQGPTGLILQSPPLRYLGKISFGIYVFHLLIPEAIKWIEARTTLSLHFPERLGAGQFWYVLAASVLLASLSWYALERPINDLKRFFPYRDRARPRTVRPDEAPSEANARPPARPEAI